LLRVVAWFASQGDLGGRAEGVADEDALFALGSVTKTVTATALVRPVAEGRFELAAPARRYGPELTGDYTVAQLLNHVLGGRPAAVRRVHGGSGVVIGVDLAGLTAGVLK
jgi:CubicO group peptidase (beta-lactamase class C family)